MLHDSTQDLRTTQWENCYSQFRIATSLTIYILQISFSKSGFLYLLSMLLFDIECELYFITGFEHCLYQIN